MPLLFQLGQLRSGFGGKLALGIVLEQGFVGERGAHGVFLAAVAFPQIKKAFHRRRRVSVFAHDFFEAVAGGGVFLLLKIKIGDVVFVLGQVCEALGELLAGFRRVGRLGMIGDDAFEVSFGDFGVLLVPIGRRELIEVGLAEAQNHQRNIFIRRVQGLKLFESVDGFRILLVEIIGLGHFELGLGDARAKGMVAPELGETIYGAHVLFLVECAHALLEERFGSGVGFGAAAPWHRGQ